MPLPRMVSEPPSLPLPLLSHRCVSHVPPPSGQECARPRVWRLQSDAALNPPFVPLLQVLQHLNCRRQAQGMDPAERLTIKLLKEALTGEVRCREGSSIFEGGAPNFH